MFLNYHHYKLLGASGCMLPFFESPTVVLVTHTSSLISSLLLFTLLSSTQAHQAPSWLRILHFLSTCFKPSSQWQSQSYLLPFIQNSTKSTASIILYYSFCPYPVLFSFIAHTTIWHDDINCPLISWTSWSSYWSHEHRDYAHFTPVTPSP